MRNSYLMHIAKSIWYERMLRQRARMILKLEDINRAFSWHLLGKKSYYTKHANVLAKAHRWCFIVGCNNSGTSLLYSILEKTEQVSAFKNEGQIYTNMLKRANKRGHERVWTEYLDELRLTEDDSGGCYPRLLHDWMRELSVPINNLIIEKTTANAVRMRWLQSVFPNSIFIGVVRNGYAITEGIIRKGGKSARRGAFHWNLVNKIMLEDAIKVNNFLLLKYEDLTDESEVTASKLAEFLDLDKYKIIEAMNDKFEYSTVVGQGKLRLTNLNSKSIARLNNKEKNIIYENANEMLEYFNYSSKITD